MSYNIGNFHVKELNNFIVPLDLLAYDYSHKRRGWKTRLEVTITDNGYIANCDIGCEGSGIGGKLDFDTRTILVDSVDVYGEGSGTAYIEILLPLFKASTGRMKAILVWADGDSVCMVTVENGEITEVNLLEAE